MANGAKEQFTIDTRKTVLPFSVKKKKVLLFSVPLSVAVQLITNQ